MKTTTINPEIAAKLIEEIENAGMSDYAEFMGLESHSSTDIEEMTVEQLMEAAEISEEEAETLLIAIVIADKPGLFGAYQVLNAAVE
jgi:spore coat polysaccharide biosynthesis protein SpsF (cytidylyltransferase family)